MYVQQKKKIGRLDLIKTKFFCTSKDNIKRVKRQTKEWEKIFANHISNKGPIPKIYKEFLQLNDKKTTQY